MLEDGLEELPAGETGSLYHGGFSGLAEVTFCKVIGWRNRAMTG